MWAGEYRNDQDHHNSIRSRTYTRSLEREPSLGVDGIQSDERKGYYR